MLGTGQARVVTIDQAAAMQLTLPYVKELIIPKGAYKASPPVPAGDLTTVGIRVSLLAQRRMAGPTGLCENLRGLNVAPAGRGRAQSVFACSAI